MSGGSPRRTYDAVKRVLDVVGAAVGLVLLSPVFVVTAVVVGLRLGRPVVFSQERPGLNGRIFTLYKFRSMLPLDPVRQRVTNEERMTRFGKLLRSTSLDELPSLWNILRGDMSVVGPRPLRVSYLERYSREQSRRHEVRPGLTGLAQVSGRNVLDWDERLRLDIDYVDRRSALLDAKIVAQTVLTVLRRSGIAEEGQATASEFFGPQKTSRLELVDLEPQHLPTRVEWLNSASVRKGISISFDADLPTTAAWFHSASADASRCDWVGVSRSGEPLSMCGIRRTGGGEANLYLYVGPERQGQGYGRETMELLVASARRQGIRQLTLETPQHNRAAIHLYKALGFESTGSSPDGLKRMMALNLRTGHSDERPS